MTMQVEERSCRAATPLLHHQRFCCNCEKIIRVCNICKRCNGPGNG